MTGPPFLLPFMRRRPAKDLINERAYACVDGAREKYPYMGFSELRDSGKL